MKSERGITLIELMIGSMLSLIVLAIVGGMLINSLSAERIVSDSTQASNTGQLVATSITRGVRDADMLALTEPVPGAQMLVGRVAGTDDRPAALVCQAWYFADGEVRMMRSTTAIAAPTAAQLATWTLVGDGMKQVASDPIITLTVTPTERRVDIELDASVAGNPPVRVSTSAVSRQPDRSSETVKCS